MKIPHVHTISPQHFCVCMTFPRRRCLVSVVDALSVTAASYRLNKALRHFLCLLCLLLSALNILKDSRMSSRPTIMKIMSYDSESSYEEQESKRRRAEKAALLAAAFFCAENCRKHKPPGRKRSANKKRNRKDPVEILQKVSMMDISWISTVCPKTLLKLHSLLKPDLKASVHSRRGDVIDSLSKVMMALRYLIGSRWVDIVRIHGVSKPVVFFCIRQVLREVNRHPVVGKPKFPTDEVEAEQYAKEWGNLIYFVTTSFLSLSLRVWYGHPLYAKTLGYSLTMFCLTRYIIYLATA